ncbi:MAG: BMC domain-containing protein [Clostridia bacterium]|nr:BMC domain-containing protein [Clostridia bacterium]
MEFSLGLVEVSALGNAIMMLDEMLKVADVEFIGVERKLGGALVTVVVRGSVSAVNASVEAGRRFAENAGVLKAAEVIARPHSEILKFLNLPQDEKKEAPKPEKPVKVEPKEEPVVKAEKPAEKKVAKPKANTTKTAPKTTKTATKTAKSKAKKA